MSSNGTNFPNIPELRAKWVPVYMEPIMNSGEKITVGIVAASKDWHVEVLPTLRKDILKRAFGNEGLSLVEGAKVCLAEFSEYLLARKQFSGWEPPFTGVTLGKERDAAGEDLDAILRIAARMSASLFADSIGARNAATQHRNGSRPANIRRWRRQIIDAVKYDAPELIHNFNQVCLFAKNAKNGKKGIETPFDYLGSQYVANFGIAKAEQKQVLDRCRIQLWNLAQCRDEHQNRDNAKFELIVWRPERDNQYYDKLQMEAIDQVMYELEEEAQKRALHTLSVNGADAASERIIELDLASNY